MCQAVRNRPDGTTENITFDFAEKVLLPRLIRPPGQIHFITELKFNLFGDACSNMDEVFRLGLPEGHWPYNETSNEVISMLETVISLQKWRDSVCRHAEDLSLHCDNCRGQKKNKCMLWFIAYLETTQYKTVTLQVLVPGHTKNRCDGAFGLVKQKVK